MDNHDSTTRIGIWIPLTKGKCALVDREDYELVMQHKWFALFHKKANVWYAERGSGNGKPQSRRTKMHRFILGLPPNRPIVDHADRDGLNNSRSNLRITKGGQNRQNAIVSRNNISGYKGVGKRVSGHWVRYAANIGYDGKTLRLGLFMTAEEAARAYDAAAIRLHGEFARPNFPDLKT